MCHADFAISTFSIPNRKCNFAALHYTIFPQKTQNFAQIGCFLGQIFHTKKQPKFFNLGALVCGNYPPIDIPEMVKMHLKTAPRDFINTKSRPTKLK